MPPKTPKSKTNSRRRKTPKKKGKSKKKPKISRKMKRLLKKYGKVMYDGKYIATEPRDELEAIAHKLIEEVTLERSERIRFQLERDFLYDLVSLYLARHRELELRIQSQKAQTNKLIQDKEEMGIIKGQQGKHFRYEVMLRRGRLEMADELRRQDLVAHADRVWQNACASMDQQADIQEARENQFLKQMSQTETELNDLNDHLTKRKAEMVKFAKECVVRVDQALKDSAMITKMDSIESQEVLNEILFASSALHDTMYETMQNYYNDLTSNNLNVILTMRDRYDELTDQNKFMTQEIEKYEDGAYRASKLLKKLKNLHARAKTKHDHTIRLEQGNVTTLKSIKWSERRLHELDAIHHQLLQELNTITQERDYLRNSANTLAEGMAKTFSQTFQIQHAQRKTRAAVCLRNSVENKLLKLYPGPEEYMQDVEPYRMSTLRRVHAVETMGQKLTLKQWEAVNRQQL